MITACMLSFMGTTLVMAGPGDDSWDIPENHIYAPSRIGKVEKLTYEEGAFTATINGKDHKIHKYDVDKTIRDRSSEDLEGFLQLGGSFIIGQQTMIGTDEKSYSITVGNGLLGGSGRGKAIVTGGKLAYKGGKWVAKEVAKQEAVRQGVKVVKWTGKQVGTGAKKTARVAKKVFKFVF